MQIRNFTLEILSPLILTSIGGDENIVTTEKVISGNALLGALASEYVKEKQLGTAAHKDLNFKDWFLSGGVTYTNAYPLGKEKYNDADFPYLPTPLCIQHVKGDDENYDNTFIRRDEKESYKSNEKMSIITNDKMYNESLSTKYNFHHERNYSTGITEEGKIFTYESLEAGYIFKASISGEENILQSLRKWIGKERTLYIGRSKNSQYGKVRIQFLDNDESQKEEDAGKEMVLSEGKYLLSLTSDTVLLNENGFPSTSIEYLKAYFPNCNVKIEKYIIKQKSINGFNGAWKLKKVTDISWKAGSCFLITFDSKDEEKIKIILNDLKQTGIGSRTHEGFGRFRILEGDPKLIAPEGKDKEKIKPLTISRNINVDLKNISPETKQLIEFVYKAELIKLVQTKAQDDIGKLNDKNLAKSKSSFVSHILSFLNKDTGKFEYKDHKDKDRPLVKELHRALHRNVERLSLEGRFIFDYFVDLEIKAESLIQHNQQFESLLNDYPFLKQLSLERELRFTYFKTFVSLLRKKIKQNKPREMQGDKK